MVKEDSKRTAGSGEVFEDDWQRVLHQDDRRYTIFPALKSDRQVDLLEWIKVQQIIKILKDVGIRNGNILEYGCGAAGISLYLASIGYQAYVCDLSINALKVARKNQKYHFPTVELNGSVAGDARLLPYKDDSFDVVMSYGLLEHFEMAPLKSVLKDTVRVLKSGGLFIADIVPGPERLNARTLGLVFSFIGSTVLHTIRGRVKQIPQLYRRYFDYYYENTHDDFFWKDILTSHGLEEVRVDVCRPFPPLSLWGGSERLYTNFIRKNIKFHQRFDQATNWFTRRWGWMYLASGLKSGKRRG